MENERLVEFIDGLKEIIKEEERQLKAKKNIGIIMDMFGGNKHTDIVAKLSQEAIDFMTKQKEDEIAFYKDILARAEAELKKAQ